DYDIAGQGLGQVTWDMGFAISTRDPQLMVAAGIFPYRSTDGGRTWKSFPGMHYDIQSCSIIGDSVWLTHDGGVTLSTDRGGTITDRSKGISATEVWGFDQSHDGHVMALGAYHLPTFVRDTTVYASGRPFDGWYPWAGADAMGANVNPIATEWIYAKPWSNVRALRTRSKLAPPSSSELGIDLGYITLNNICFDPVDYFHIVAPDYGSQRLVASRDNASSWSTLKQFSRWVHRARIHPHIPGIIMVLGDDALWLSTDRGVSWSNVTPPSSVGKGKGMVDMAFDSKDPLHMYLAYGGNQSEVKVVESTDGGRTWTSISQGLPSFAVFTMIARSGAPGELYVGTSYGVYRCDTTGTWQPFGKGLPYTNVSFLEIDYPNGLLRAATNRGLWQAPISAQSQPEAQISRNTDTVRCSRVPVRFGCRSAALETQAFGREWKFPGGVPSTSSSPIVDVFYSVPGTYDVELIVKNEYGQSHSVLTNAVTVLQSECDGFDAVPGNAADLTRDGDHITLGRMPQKVREFTFTAWVRPFGLQPGFSAILCTDADPNVSQEVGLQFANDKNELGYLWSGGRWWWGSGLTLRPDVWSHVALTIDSTGATVYVNGIPSRDATPLPAIDLSQLVFKLGTYHYWSSRNFKGLIDEVALYSRCLTLKEIRSGMHLTKPGPQDGLMAYYQFNESRAGNIYDKVAARDGRYEAGSGLVASGAPVAGGRSELRRLAAGQRLIPFTAVGDTCVLYQPLSDSVDVVMTRFDRTAVAPPAQDKNCLEGSWRILDVFGPVTVAEVSDMTLSADSRYMPENPSVRTWGVLTRSGWNLSEPWSAARIPSNGELKIRGTSITSSADRGLLTPLQLMVTYSGQAVSVDDQAVPREVVLTPQPAMDILRISAPEAITHVVISDVSGRVLNEWRFSGTSLEQGLDVTGLSSGTYVVDVDGRRQVSIILR
ncbi:MAG: LamG-like jellyroll fold domain-containing protein, partial [Candidatus Kapaibacterium sp.]